MMSDLIFVYGTLMLEATNSFARQFHAQSTFLGKATWMGKLYQVIHYPGAVKSSNPDELIHGEIWQMKSPVVTLKMLDEYEECSPTHPLPHEYLRSLENIKLNHNDVCAWVYIYQREISHLKHLKSGIFKHAQAK